MRCRRLLQFSHFTARSEKRDIGRRIFKGNFTIYSPLACVVEGSTIKLYLSLHPEQPARTAKALQRGTHLSLKACEKNDEHCRVYRTSVHTRCKTTLLNTSQPQMSHEQSVSAIKAMKMTLYQFSPRGESRTSAVRE